MRKSILVVASLAALPAIASADATVQVRLSDSLGRPIDGTVSLSGQGGVRSCTTVASRCTISVPGGTYTAALAPVRGAAPPPRSVTLPATGVVALQLAALDAPVHGGAPIAVGAPVAQPVGVVPTQPQGTVAIRPTPLGGASVQPMGAPATASPADPVRLGGSGFVVGPSPGPVVATPTMPAPAAQPSAVPTPVATGRNLGAGRQLVAQGTITDMAGRPADATLTIHSGAMALGSVSSTAGRFSLFDLAPGTYGVSIRSARGSVSSASLQIAAGVARVVFRVP